MPCRVAIVDSGIDPRATELQPLESGVHLRVVADRAHEDADWSDALGHGTAVARIVRQGTTTSVLHAVRIFRNKLVAPVTAFVAAIDWAREHEMNLVCVSVGVSELQWRGSFESAVLAAQRAGILIVARAGTDEAPNLPGVIPGVLAVRGAEVPFTGRFVIDNQVVLASTRSGSVPLRPRALFPDGAAVAVARVSGVVARWFDESAPGDAQASREYLASLG